MQFFRGDLPVWLGLVAGLVVLLELFFNVPLISQLNDRFLEIRVILAAFALALGGGNLLRVHANNIRLKRGHSWIYSYATIACLIGFFALGIIAREGTASAPYSFIFDNVYSPLGATVFSLNAFWISTACYRAFRVRNLQAAVLLIAGVTVMLGKVGIGSAIWPGFAEITDWIMNNPNSAAMRGINMGAALGMVGVGLRVILGLERGHLGGAKE